MIAGTIVGGIAGAFDPAAGMLIAHNYAVAGFQSFRIPNAQQGQAVAQVSQGQSGQAPQTLLRGVGAAMR
ncbi:hypothetical protein, partial [Listeria monocytogenes]|uniref:hypothetical protein n=1 Tax=Listeria monocytogenes TaxID=1639 RepID=UPI003FA459D9